MKTAGVVGATHASPLRKITRSEQEPEEIRSSVKINGVKMAMQPPEPKRKRSGQLSSVQVMFAAILAIGLALAINLSSLVNSAQPLQEKYRQLTTEIAQLEQEQGQLVVERDYAESDAYVESWARSDGKMVKAGEVLVVPVPSGIDVEPTVVPQVEVAVETTPPKPETWMLWWALFFDSPPPTLGS